MFDFLKYAYKELNEIVVDDTNKDGNLKANEEKRLKRSTKIAILFIGFMYIFVSIYSIVLVVKNGLDLKILKYILLLVLDLMIIVMTFINREVVYRPIIALSFIFILLNFMF